MSEAKQGEIFEFETRKVIKGFPELHWTGKRPYTSTIYYPAQPKEQCGEAVNGWLNKIYWGDNLQVMSHLLKDYRGMVDLIYIDPPFDSKADYKKKIVLKGKKIENDNNSFEEKQYGDIWTNDEYLQFMYERLILCRELLASTGSIYVHCDWHKSHHLRCILDDIFGPGNFKNNIIWQYQGSWVEPKNNFPRRNQEILFYTKSKNYTFNLTYDDNYVEKGVFQRWNKYIIDGKIYGDNYPETDGKFEPYLNAFIKQNDRNPKDKNDIIVEFNGPQAGSVWYMSTVNPISPENKGYPTQKPESVLERIIMASSNPGDLVFDCFMGSGTTQAVAMKLGRRFIGADINLGAVHTTTKRLLKVARELNSATQTVLLNSDSEKPEEDVKYTGFEIYNVNNYDFFRYPGQAKELIIKALSIQPFAAGNIWDGELDGRMVKIMPVNRIATKADLEELVSNMPYGSYETKWQENPNKPVEEITIICMGHEPDLKRAIKEANPKYRFDVEVVDILRDKKELQLKRDTEANIVREGNKLVIRDYYPMNLLQKLSLEKEYVGDDWRQMVETVAIDFNYDGAVLQPSVVDIPERDELVKGVYDIPADAGTIKVKITDVLSETFEMEL